MRERRPKRVVQPTTYRCGQKGCTFTARQLMQMVQHGILAHGLELGRER